MSNFKKFIEWMESEEQLDDQDAGLVYQTIKSKAEEFLGIENSCSLIGKTFLKEQIVTFKIDVWQDIETKFPDIDQEIWVLRKMDGKFVIQQWKWSESERENYFINNVISWMLCDKPKLPAICTFNNFFNNPKE